jgi:pimeloyl-ACP methyl ester carboxylesterase
MLTEKTFDTGTVSIHYAEGPSGGKPMVLLHGVTGRWQHFLSNLPEFSFRYHTYALDLRGHGKSGRTPGAYRIENYAQDVVAFLHQRVAEPAILLGHSLGAMTAIQAAADAPERVAAVVLEDPPFSSVAKPESPSRQRFSVMRDIVEMEGTFEDKMKAHAAYMKSPHDARLRSRIRQLVQLDPDVLTHTVERKTFEHFRAEDVLSRITAPVLLLQGNPALGGALDDPEAEWILSHLVHGTRVQVAEAGHDLHREHQLTFMQIVNDFLESL